MLHNPGICEEWSPEEQAILEAGLSRHASEPSLIRYAKIGVQLPNKTVRDVALRSRWMTTKDCSKRRREEHNASRRNRDRRERITDTSSRPSYFANRINSPSYSLSLAHKDHKFGSGYRAIGGAIGEVLEQNAKIFSQISANLQSLQVEENINLFRQTRNNIHKIMNKINESPEFMHKRMPALSVELNEELAGFILPSTSTF